ncbi:MAG: hypothetical protein FD143_3282, partial [Ignavibacteria bacterium]
MNSEYIVCLQNFDKKFFRPSYQKSQIKNFLNKKNTPFVKKRYKKNQTSPYSDYQLKSDV